MNLSKTTYCDGVQCKKMLWLKKFKPECAVADEDKTKKENGIKVGNLAKGLFGKYENVEKDDNHIMVQKTRELMLKEPNIITEASFSFDNNFCSVDVLKNDRDGVEIYEVKSSTSIYVDDSDKKKEEYLNDAAFQYFVLSRLDLNVKKVCIVHVNKNYKLDKKFSIKKFFKIEDITEEVKQRQDEVRINIEMMKKYIDEHGSENEPIKKIGMHCFRPYPCAFWQYCTRELPEPNVFDLRGMRSSTKLKKYYDGKITFKDLKKEYVSKKKKASKKNNESKNEYLDKYEQQIDYEINEINPDIDEDAISRFLESLEYPLYFIDYETIRPVIPIIEGTKPYQQIPFQYSLHIIKEENDDEAEHKEFLAEVDDENMIRTFAENMIKDIPEEGSVIVYNKDFEYNRNKEIAEMFPDLKKSMCKINCNMVDIMVPFKERKYYTKEMQGSYSLKYVLPALYPDDPELDYSNLPVVHNGGEASDAFESLKDKSAEEQEEIREGLLKYCELDTLAMVKIWRKFKEVVE